MAIPDIVKIALAEPDYSLPPESLILLSAGGAAAVSPEKRRLRNALLAAATAGGALTGGYLGGQGKEYPTAGRLIGGLTGGALGLLASRMALDELLTSQPSRSKYAASPIHTLLKAKSESDRRNYKQKHALIRQLMQQYPGDFSIDSEDGNILGITHKSGFRFHLPRNVVPAKPIQLPPTPKPAPIELPLEGTVANG